MIEENINFSFQKILKASLFEKKVKQLNYMIFAEGITTDPEKVTAESQQIDNSFVI